MGASLLYTPCHAWHVAHGGRMVDFAGWDMPVQYTSIVEEHTATRTAAGLFDISHMGRLAFRCRGADEFLEYLLTNRVGDLDVGQVRYSLITNDAGGILDDVLAYRFDDFYMLVVNASNREKLVAWISRLQARGSIEVTDVTFDFPMLAVQGPLSANVLQPLVQDNLETIGYYRAIETKLDGDYAIVSRTGYTGEDGFEVIVSADRALAVWERIFAAGQPHGLKPVGLAARDTLRLEAAMPLYGHELTEVINPFQAGLDWAVKLDKPDFVGKTALVRSAAGQPLPRRIGLTLADRRIARQGYAVLTADGSRQVGEVTSGTFSPTLAKPIAMAYVEPGHDAVGTELAVDVRGHRVAATVVKLPFYRRTRKAVG